MKCIVLQNVESWSSICRVRARRSGSSRPGSSVSKCNIGCEFDGDEITVRTHEGAARPGMRIMSCSGSTVTGDSRHDCLHRECDAIESLRERAGAADSGTRTKGCP